MTFNKYLFLYIQTCKSDIQCFDLDKISSDDLRQKRKLDVDSSFSEFFIKERI